MFFSPVEERTFCHIASRIIPLDLEKHGEDMAEAVKIAGEVLLEKDPSFQKLFHKLLFVFEKMAFLFYLRPFSKLLPEKQDAYLRFWETCPFSAKLRQGFWGFKTLALMGYYTREQSWKGIQYDGSMNSD